VEARGVGIRRRRWRRAALKKDLPCWPARKALRVADQVPKAARWRAPERSRTEDGCRRQAPCQSRGCAALARRLATPAEESSPPRPVGRWRLLQMGAAMQACAAAAMRPCSSSMQSGQLRRRASVHSAGPIGMREALPDLPVWGVPARLRGAPDAALTRLRWAPQPAAAACGQIPNTREALPLALGRLRGVALSSASAAAPASLRLGCPAWGPRGTRRSCAQ